MTYIEMSMDLHIHEIKNANFDNKDTMNLNLLQTVILRNKNKRI